VVQIYTEDTGAWSDVDVYSRRILVAGRVTFTDWEFVTDQQAYLDSTPGAFTFTRPTTGHIALLGDATWPNTLRFDPSSEEFYEWVVWDGSAIAYDGTRYIYEFGGDDGEGVHNYLRRLDTWTFTWVDLTAGCTARRDAAMVWVLGYLYIYGGQDADGNALSTLCIYSTWTDSWQGPYETSCGARISPVMLPWYNSTTGRWEIHIVGGYDSSGPVSSVCIYTPDDGGGNTPDEGTPPDDVVPEDFTPGEDAPDGFDDDMDWHPPGSENSDDAFQQVNCYPGYDATDKFSAESTVTPCEIDGKLYLWSGVDEAFIEFDTATGGWTTHAITNLGDFSGSPVYMETYAGKIYLIFEFQLGGEVAGCISAAQWTPGQSTLIDLGSPEYNNGSEGPVFCFISGSALYLYQESGFRFDESGPVFRVLNLSTGYWGNDVNLAAPLTWYANNISDGIASFQLNYVDPDSLGTIIQADSETSDWPGTPPWDYVFMGYSENKIYCYSPSWYNVRYFDKTGGQWFEFAGTIFKDEIETYASPPADLLGKRLFKVGNYLYIFATEWDELGESQSLCMWRFDTTWSEGSSLGAYPVTRSFLSSSSILAIMGRRSANEISSNFYLYTPDPVNGKHWTLISMTDTQSDWGEVDLRAALYESLKDKGIWDFSIEPLLFDPNNRISVQGDPDPLNPNSVQYVRADASGHLYFNTVEA